MQVHGGMGFIEETGAAQYLRDARIITIYEGTTGIQANDLVGRKIARDGGATAKAWLGEVKKLDAELARPPGDPQSASPTACKAVDGLRRVHRRRARIRARSSPARCRSSS